MAERSGIHLARPAKVDNGFLSFSSSQLLPRVLKGGRLAGLRLPPENPRYNNA